MIITISSTDKRNVYRRCLDEEAKGGDCIVPFHSNYISKKSFNYRDRFVKYHFAGIDDCVIYRAIYKAGERE